MGYGRREDPKLFHDEQMRQYIADGYVVFKPNVPDDLHETIRQKLQLMVDEEFNYGNNVLPRVPEMDRILNSPEVRGALISVLGPGYIEHPHRFCHYISPDATGRPMTRSASTPQWYLRASAKTPHLPKPFCSTHYPIPTVTSLHLPWKHCGG